MERINRATETSWSPVPEPCQTRRRTRVWKAVLVMLGLVAVVGCERAPVEGPMEVTMRYGNKIPVAQARAEVTVGEPNFEDNTIMARIECEAETRVVTLSTHTYSDTICGVRLRHLQFLVIPGGPPTSSSVMVDW